MNLLSDILTYIRRIIKSPSNSDISDDLLIDYVNRFWIMDMDARMQLFDLKTTYSFQTAPGVDRYNMPLYDIQTEPGNQTIASYPVYQGFLGPAYVNGVQVPVETQKNLFTNMWPEIVQNMPVVTVGDGTSGPYTLTFPIGPNNTVPLNPPVSAIIRGHIDITGIIASGSNIDPPLVTALSITNNDPFIQRIPVTSVDSAVYVTTTGADGSNIVLADSGQFLDSNQNFGLMMEVGKAPFGNLPLTGGPSPNYSITQNTVNYFTGVITNLYFPVAVPVGVNINVQCFYFQTGLPRSILFYNNTLTLRSPPATQYLVEISAYLTPAAFLSTSQGLAFGYMSEYIARGAARKILSDTGDVEQFNFYEPFFREQELLVWKRSQRQWTSTRTHTIYSQGQSGFNNSGGSIY